MASGDMVAAFRSCAASVASAVGAPPKPYARNSMSKSNNGNKPLSLEDVHKSIIMALKNCTDSLLLKIDNNTKSILKVCERLDNLFNEMGEIKVSVETVKHVTPDHEKRIKALEMKLNKQESLQSRWNLRLYGVQENTGVNLKTKVIDICSGVAPEMAKALQTYVDFCHRLGRGVDGKPCPILIRFNSIDVKKKIWKAATNSGLSFAFFVGAKAIIDGRVVTQ